jgi:hypothetical protein
MMQFADIVRYWTRFKAEMEADVAKSINDWGIEMPIAWVVGNTDALFGTTITSDLGLEEVASERWLHSGRGTDGQLLSWTDDIVCRLNAGVRWDRGK